MPTMNATATVALDLVIVLSSAFLCSRLTKRLHLPNVSGYLLAGILIGPYGLKWIDQETVVEMGFLTDGALALIAFSVGRYLKWDTLRLSGIRVARIALAETFLAAIVTAIAMGLAGLPAHLAMLLGSIAAATAPASTMMTIRQYKARGHYVDTLLQTIALDNAIALSLFGVCLAVAQGGSQGGFSPWRIWLPLACNGLMILVGGGLGFALKWALQRVTSNYNRILVAIIFLLALTGLCAALNISPLLSCMTFGAVHANTVHKGALFKKMDQLSPPVLTLFFVLSGMKLNLAVLASAGWLGLIYFAVRIAGKYAGARLGASLARETEDVRKCLGLALIPQAGVSIGLAALAERTLPPEMGMLLSTIVLSSAVLYELVGPALAKRSMCLAGAIPREEKKPLFAGTVQQKKAFPPS